MKPYHLAVTRKPIKHIYLRVVPPDTVNVSCGLSVKDAEIERILSAKAEWIERKLSDNPPVQSYGLSDGATVLLAETRYPLRLSFGTTNRLRFDGGTLFVRARDAANADRMILAWYRKTLKVYGEERLRCLGKRFGIPTGNLPKVAVRMMHSRWGSYSKKTHTVALSAVLGTYPKETIDSVICHELAHLRYMNHQSKFYELLLTADPMYRQNTKALKTKRGNPYWYLTCE
jgi:predicted metal-dependent hydrolase